MSNSFEYSGPHIKQLDTIEKTMWNVVIALVPAIIASVYFFGTYSLYLIGATALTCVVVEIPFHKKLSGGKRLIGDGSAVVTGVILGLSLPPTSPWWIPILGGVLSIIIGKQLFGGLGNNIFNPALVGRAILAISWPLYMTEWVTPFDGITTSTPLMAARASTNYLNLFIGNIPGSIGETSALALLIGAFYLYKRGYLDLRISLSYVGASAVTALILGVNPLFTILAGSLIFGAFFIATDMVSSPSTKSGRVAYGVGCGFLTVVIRVFTAYPEGVTFAILIMNGFSHLFDTLLEGYIFGQVYKKKKKIKQAGALVIASIIFVVIAYTGIVLTDTEFLEQHHRVFNEHMGSFFPRADKFNMLEDLNKDRLLAEVIKDGERIGFLAYVSRTGYSGQIENMIAIDPDGEVLGSRVIEHYESATLGGQVAQQGFLEQFEGLRHSDLTPTINSNFDLDTITNATLSSIAVAQTVESALDLVERQLQGPKYDYFEIPNGWYYGTGNGMWGEVEAQVKIEEGFLHEVNILDHKDTPHVARSAFERLEGRIVRAQNTDVDVVSGSTMSSRGMLAAVDDALAGEKVEVYKTGFEMPDGVYTGRAAGMIDEIVVEITVEDNELTDIKLMDHEETTYLADPAFERLKERVLTEQTTDVDIVSGATMTSRGFLAAIGNAVLSIEDEFNIPVDDGTYTGYGEGYKDQIEVEVDVVDGQISDIKVLEHSDTPDIAESAFEKLRELVIDRQTTSVDSITGATNSSEGFLKAVEDALGVESPDYEDGTYTATGEGYNGEIEIEVVITDGAIESIEILEHSDTEDIAEPAFEDLIEAAKSTQSAEIDAVSGATNSSEGFIEALESALEQAGSEEEESDDQSEEASEGDDVEAAEVLEGRAEGHNGELVVEVSLDDAGEIMAIDIVEHSETDGIADPALEEIPAAIIENQSTDVDIVSGATVTSEAIMKA
ncbi:MAG: RnfABCDGE type electron transport complex subunit D, partial [Halarsenatibacteraceae bacterium]